jgi:endonuclease YncB( thermonuclease family)
MPRPDLAFSWARRLADLPPSRWPRRVPTARLGPPPALRPVLRTADWALLLQQTWRRAGLAPRKVAAAVSVIAAVLAIAGIAAYVAHRPRMRAAAPAAPPAPASDTQPVPPQPAKISDSLLPQGWTSLAEAYQPYAVRVAADGTLLGDNGPIQLYGVRVPIRSQVCTYQTGERWACGQRAYIALLNFVGKTTIACRLRNSDQAGVFVCKLAGINIGQWLLRSGWATLADGVTDKRYVAAADEGVKSKSGMWAAGP